MIRVWGGGRRLDWGFVYYWSVKREVNIELMQEYRCYERVKVKTEGISRFTYTGLRGELESVCTVDWQHIMNTGSGRPSTLDTRISVVLLPHTLFWNFFYLRDLVWTGSAPHERWFDSTIRLHRLGCVGIKECGPKENTVRRDNVQFRMTETQS